MADRLDISKLRREYLIPEAAPFLLALLQLATHRARMVEAYRQRHPGLTILDTILHLHIFVFDVIGAGGTRPQTLVDSTGAPRRTIRDGLVRLQRAELIVRDEAGLYFPAETAAPMNDDGFDAYFRVIAKLCDTFGAFRKALER